ncbi:MAG TPA: ABC transporter ATP-binding protein [Spirochaetota bacterium]|nr:ABC transporter ATP-binding protein [Spirochaetota bacterium]HRZ25823.1 ABC transporter ATP-binding protein [Spirochaetota bacterium]
MSEPVIQLKGISKKYNLYGSRLDRVKEALDPRNKSHHKDFYALKNISLDVHSGEILGIVGKNGSGKSTLLEVVSGVLTPTRGDVRTEGNIVALLELGSGFNPEFTGLDNIYFYSALLGYRRKEIDDVIGDIIEFSELGDFIDQPLKTYSSGMKARLAFSVSVNVDPDILILDEVLSVGDELFRRKCYARMEQFFSSGKTILFVSHSAHTINEICTRAILLDRGEIIFEGPTKLVTALYQKYLYSPKERIESSRNEIIALNLSKEYKTSIDEDYSLQELEPGAGSGPDCSPTVKGGASHLAPRSYFIPEMKPRTTVEYKSYDVDISDVKLTTSSDEQVNMLLLDEKYVLSYRATFNCDAEDVSFGMLFKTERGVQLGGGVTPGVNTYIPYVAKGSVFRIEWRFSCNFFQGLYYINAGVRGRVNGEIVYLNRIVDSLVFKVQREYDDIYTGQLFFYQDPVIVPIVNPEDPKK